MSKGIKAALLSALIFPGVGQIKLKRYKRGIILISLVCFALITIVWMATQTAYRIMNQELKSGVIDIRRIFEVSHNYAHGGVDNAYYYACFLTIVGCWIYGIIDALFYSGE